MPLRLCPQGHNNCCIVCLQRWARAFRENDYHAAVNTNNGTEALNKVLKYNYLPRKKNITLSTVCTILIESFLPDAHQKYLCLNYMQSNQYRSYKSHVPDYLHDRPKGVIIHCLERKSKALKYTEEDVQEHKDDGVFTVRRSKGKMHTVRITANAEDDMPACTCVDWQQWHIPCKHMFAVFNTQGGWTWNRFHPNYLNGPYLSSDSLSLNEYFKDEPVQCTDDIEQATQTLLPPPTQDKLSHLPIRKVFPFYSVHGCQNHTLLVNLHILHVLFLLHRPLRLH